MDLKFYNVTNTAGSGMWVLAQSENHAQEIALKFRHVKNIKNANVTEIKLELRDDLAYYIENNLTGRLSKRIQTLTFQEMLSGKKSDPGTWILQRDSDKMFIDPYGNEAKYGYELPIPTQ